MKKLLVYLIILLLPGYSFAQFGKIKPSNSKSDSPKSVNIDFSKIKLESRL
jgi:hypothetical protein